MRDKSIKELKLEIRSLKKDVEFWQSKALKHSLQNTEMKDYLTNKFNWFVDILAEGKTPLLPFLIKDFKDALIRFK